MHARWIPWADTTAQRFDLVNPGVTMPTVDKLLLHTTEGSSWPAYGGGRSAPNATLMIDWENERAHVRQHFPADMSSKALADDSSDGYRTNRDNVFQLEIVGTSGWATTRNKSRSYTLPEIWYVAGWPEWALLEIARIWVWLHQEWDVPLTLPSGGFGSWATGVTRLSDKAFHDYKGLIGHQHAPDNDHTDPGALPGATLLRLAQELTNQEETMPITDADAQKIARAVWAQTVGREQATTADGRKVPMTALMAVQSIYHSARGSGGSLLKKIADKIGV